MTRKELKKYGLIQQIEEKKISQMKAAEMLGISDRHFRRLLKAYRERGVNGLLSKRRGKPSNRRTPEKVREQVVNVLKEKYEGFGPTLATEKLEENHQIKVSIETVRKWMIEEELWKARKQRKIQVHQSRSRRGKEGELIQIDGSPHDWFEGKRDKCCLLGFIDDATSKIMHLKFTEVETTAGYLESFKRVHKKTWETRKLLQ